MHIRWSGIRGSIAKATNFMGKRYLGLLDKNLDKRITLDGDDIETVDKFYSEMFLSLREEYKKL